MKKYIIITFFVIVLLSALGCLEHTYYIQILPNEQVGLSYEVRGDQIDLNDGRELFPDSTLWGIQRRVEEHNDETVHILEGMIYLDNVNEIDSVLDWSKTEKDTVYLQRYVSVTKIQRLFGRTWIFKGIIYSRRFNELYGDIWNYVPSECRALDEEELRQTLTSEEIIELENKFSLGIFQWNRARFEQRFDQLWEIIKTRFPNLPDTSATIYSIARAGWMDDLHRYLNELEIPEDPAMTNLDWWNDLRPLFVGRLIDITGSEIAGEIIKIGNAIEQKYQITKDIEDDLYYFKVRMPGIITSTNANTTSEEDDDDEWIKWDFNGKYLWNSNGIMDASSFEISIWRTGVGILVLIIVLNLFRRKLIQLRTKSKL